MDERISPQMFVTYAAARRGVAIEELGVAPIVVFSWRRRINESLAESVGAQLSPHWIHGEHYPLYTGIVGGHRVSFANVPLGAPGTIMIMDEMIACGAKVFLGLGTAGSLQPEAPVGTYLIPVACIREEGTSFHYLGNDVVIGPSPRLAEIIRQSCHTLGLEVKSGPHWTTDAIFRELLTKIEAYGKQGVLGVDMETSAMYALGHVRGVEVCNLLVVSDELWHEWRPGFGQPEMQDALKCAENVILDCLTKGLAI